MYSHKAQQARGQPASFTGHDNDVHMCRKMNEILGGTSTDQLTSNLGSRQSEKETTKWLRVTAGGVVKGLPQKSTKYKSTRSRLPMREGGVTLNPWMNEFSSEWTGFGKKTVCVSKPNSIAIFLDRWTYENSRCYPHVESVSNLAWTSWRKSAAR